MSDNDDDNNLAPPPPTWEQLRRRPDGNFDVKILGFGPPSFPISLWVPSTKGAKYYFRDGGKIDVRLPPALARNPIIPHLRYQVAKGLEADDADPPTRMRAGF